MDYELGFIGGGNMAEAIVRAAVERGVVPAGKIVVSDPSAHRLELIQKLGVKAVGSNLEVVRGSGQVVLAIKPQMLEKIAGDLQAVDADNQVLVTIMAGVTCEKIERVIGRTARIVRVMPNTPLLVGLGMSAVAVGKNARPGDESLAMKLFAAAGEVVRLEESLMDAVTAVSGSGPAYVFYLAEAMIEAAQSMGLSPDHAALLSRQTILGAAKLMKDFSDAPAELRRKVTSPGGTTQAAIEHMDSRYVREAVVAAIQRAAERGKELGQ